MRSLAVITLLASLVALTTANESEPNIPSAALDELKQMKGEVASPLLERATALTKCPKSNGCTCKKGTKQGQYCGWCDQVTYVGTGGRIAYHIYECNSDGGCCDYGESSSCDTYEESRRNCPR
ncbi:hypothetical protein QBC47DRAFT_398743 [Echria macrotheca]|uniref:Uncharacterized protein n=1 Tax=Echria macrotheca TaxID=438768 RepID=A0AAJ0BKG9_9PEZI|nr:hypothetical protein QBC47DRAFT_398743 [Echria macrotheca]